MNFSGSVLLESDDETSSVSSTSLGDIDLAGPGVVSVGRVVFELFREVDRFFDDFEVFDRVGNFNPPLADRRVYHAAVAGGYRYGERAKRRVITAPAQDIPGIPVPVLSPHVHLCPASTALLDLPITRESGVLFSRFFVAEHITKTTQ